MFCLYFMKVERDRPLEYLVGVSELSGRVYSCYRYTGEADMFCDVYGEC